MKFFLFSIVILFSNLLGYSQIEKLKYDVSFYKDEVYEVIYLAGITDDAKGLILKLDKDFKVIAELQIPKSLGKLSKCKADLKPPFMKFYELDHKGKTLNTYSFNQDLKMGSIDLNELDVNFKNVFIYDNLIFNYKWSSELSCFEMNDFEVKELWTSDIGNYELVDLTFFKATSEYLYFCSRSSSNSFEFFKYNVKNGEVVKVKKIESEFDAENCKSEFKYDQYRDEIYVGFVESKGEIEIDKNVRIKILTLDDSFNEIQKPIEIKKEFFQYDHSHPFYSATLYGTFNWSRAIDNKTIFTINSSGVNVQVVHSVGIGMSFSNSYTVLMGVTDVAVQESEVKVDYYNKNDLYECLNNFVMPKKGNLVVNYFRDKTFSQGKSIYIYPSTENGVLSSEKSFFNNKAKPITYTDLKNKKVVRTSEKVLIHKNDSFCQMGQNYIFDTETKSKYITSFDGDTVMWIYLSDPKLPLRPFSEYKVKYTIVIDKID